MFGKSLSETHCQYILPVFGCLKFVFVILKNLVSWDIESYVDCTFSPKSEDLISQYLNVIVNIEKLSVRCNFHSAAAICLLPDCFKFSSSWVPCSVTVLCLGMYVMSSTFGVSSNLQNFQSLFIQGVLSPLLSFVSFLNFNNRNAWSSSYTSMTLRVSFRSLSDLYFSSLNLSLTIHW